MYTPTELELLGILVGMLQRIQVFLASLKMLDSFKLFAFYLPCSSGGVRIQVLFALLTECEGIGGSVRRS